jgi:hypothetical protein
MRKIISLVLLGWLVLGCQNQNENKRGQIDILNIAIDSTLNIDPALKSKGYWIDFSKVQYFNRNSIEGFLSQRPNFKEVNGDSLFKCDSTWIRFGFLENLLISFKRIEERGDTIILNIDKYKATDGSNGIELLIIKEGNKNKVIKTRITWIS